MAADTATAPAPAAGATADAGRAAAPAGAGAPVRAAPASGSAGGARPAAEPQKSSSKPSSSSGGSAAGAAGKSDGAAQPAAGAAAKAESQPRESVWSRWFGKPKLDAKGQQAETSNDGAPSSGAAEPAKPTREQELETQVTQLQRRLADAGKEDAALVDELAKSDDPWAVQEKAAKRAQTRTAATSATHVGQILTLAGQGFDQQVLSPLLDLVPEAKRDEVRKVAGRGYAGRWALVQAAVTAIADAARAEGEKGAAATLKKDPEFRSSVLRERRASATELDLAPAMAPSNTGQDMNARMRGALGVAGRNGQAAGGTITVPRGSS